MTGSAYSSGTQETGQPRGGYDLVVGLGRSGTAIARFLRNQGRRVMATDRDPARKELEPGLRAMGVETEIGFHTAETFENAGRIITSPGIPLDMEYFQRARARGVAVIGELDLVTPCLDRPVVAVTGTNGKTTVTTLISEMLTASGFRVFTCGNIGTPLVSFFDEAVPADIVVAEISSFQLDSATGFAPEVGVLLNITEDHLDRYDGFSAYADSKWSLFRHQGPGDTAIIYSSIPDCDDRIRQIRSRVFCYGSRQSDACARGGFFTGDVLEIKGMAGASGSAGAALQSLDLSSSPLKGGHNRENLAASALAALAAGGTPQGIAQVISSFAGLAHRTEYAGTVKGVRFINDSKATNPDAVLRALEMIDAPIVLIMGGQPKDTDFTCLRAAVAQRVKCLVVTGQAADLIAGALDGCCPILRADSMKAAVTVSFNRAEEGDVVLLSPACASFDWYTSYAQRGADFMEQIKRLEASLC